MAALPNEESSEKSRSCCTIISRVTLRVTSSLRSSSLPSIKWGKWAKPNKCYSGYTGPWCVKAQIPGLVSIQSKDGNNTCHHHERTQGLSRESRLRVRVSDTPGHTSLGHRGVTLVKSPLWPLLTSETGTINNGSHPGLFSGPSERDWAHTALSIEAGPPPCLSAGPLGCFVVVL